MIDVRKQYLQHWLEQAVTYPISAITALPADASFRRYFRIQTAKKTFIAMDAPPEQEDCKPFVALARAFAKLGLNVPEIIAEDLTQGYLLLTDFGDNLYSRILNSENVEQLYGCALMELITLQRCRQVTDWDLPAFDYAFMQQELHNFKYWFIQQHLQIQLSLQEEALLEQTFKQLLIAAVEQPQVCVHRDYHSRNLIWLPQQQVGILDFQDAVRGPITYDAVSLLRDCYIAWPQKKVEQWVLQFFHQLEEAKLLTGVSAEQFMFWFDWMGIQRHLKAIFIFARKYRRDHNPNYLNDIPRALQYILDISASYSQLNSWREWLQEKTELEIAAA